MRIGWTPDNLVDLQRWRLLSNLLASRDLRDVSLDFLLYTGASTRGWGCSLLHLTASGLWSEEESALYIYLLKLRAVWVALLHFQHLPQGKTVGVFAENTTALAYLSHQGGTHSLALNDETRCILH